MERGKEWMIGFALLGLVVIILWFVFASIPFDGPRVNETSDGVYVKVVIDGDTFVLSNGEHVRLLCIDAPELGDEGADVATIYLAGLIEGKEVRLESDVSEKDVYGRLLRYVYVDDVFVNREMVREGYARVARFGNDTRRCDEIED